MCEADVIYGIENPIDIKPSDALIRSDFGLQNDYAYFLSNIIIDFICSKIDFH